MLAIIAWTTLFSALYFLIMRKVKKLRVTDVEELMGLDIMEMGSMTKAYLDKMVRQKD